MNEPSDEIYIVIERGENGMTDLFDSGYGEMVNGEPVIIEEHVDTDHCESCRDANGEAYRLKDDRHGIPVCRPCLSDMRGVVSIEESAEAVGR